MGAALLLLHLTSLLAGDWHHQRGCYDAGAALHRQVGPAATAAGGRHTDAALSGAVLSQATGGLLHRFSVTNMFNQQQQQRACVTAAAAAALSAPVPAWRFGCTCRRRPPAGAASAHAAAPCKHAAGPPPSLARLSQIATGIVLALGFDADNTLPKGDAVGALVLICVFIAGGLAGLL